MVGRLRTALARLRPPRRPPAPTYVDPSRRIVEKARLGRTRQVITQGIVAGAIAQQGIWMPITRPEGLVLLTDLVWPIGAAVDRIVEETTKGGWDFEGLFQAKCLACGAEYDVEPEMCEGPGCFSEDFRPPDEGQLDGEGFPDHGIRGLLNRPNWEEETGHVFRTTKDLLKDAVYYSNVIGGWHWEVVRSAVGRPIQLWSVLSESIRRVEDPSLSVGEWFCPRHREELDEAGTKLDEAFDQPEEGEERPFCSTHHIPLAHTAWVQLDEGDHIVSVWSAQELLADQPRARGLRIYARSKVLRVWAMGQIHRWTERYDLAALSGQRAPDQVNMIIGREQRDVNDMMDDWLAWLADNEEYQGSVWLGLGSPTAEGGTVDVKSIHQMGEMVKRDFIAWRAAEKEDIAMNLGVSFVFMGGQTAGQLGKPEELIQVSYDTIEENQSQVEEFVNGRLVPLFPEVTDWKWVMKPPAPEDEEKKARLAITLANAVRLLREAGANAKLDPQATFDFPIIIEGWEDRKEQPEFPAPGLGEPGPPRGPQPPGPLTLAQKRWEAFTGDRGGQGARNTETGQEVYGEEARRVLAGQDGEAEGPPEGDAQIPSDQEALVADVEVIAVRRDEMLGTLEVHGTVPIDQFQAGEAEPVDLERRAEAYAELMREGVEFPPLVVFGRRTADDKFQVIDGHARLEAARRAGKDTVGAEITLVNPQGRAVKMMALVEKSLTTRNLPPAEAVTGIRALEDGLAAKLTKRWDKAVKDFRVMSGRRPTPQELRRLMEDVSAGLRTEFARLGRDHVARVYRLALEEDMGVFPQAEMEGVDRRLLEELAARPDLLQGRLSKVIEDATGILNEAIQESLAPGADAAQVVRDAADRLGEELWRVDRVVRSATTDIANAARLTQFDKYGEPEDEYGFVTAKDRRRCPICKAADDGIDTLTAEERAEFDRSEYDPALFHGNPYTLAEVKVLWQIHNSFHGNCRCTVRRHVRLT